MVDRKFYKTRLCALYQRGRCSRQHCNFAHSEAELRRSFNGKQEYHGRDLRESLGRKRSPLHKFSPGRDIGARHSSHGNSSSSPRQRIDRNHRKRQKMDDLRENSGSLRMPDGVEDQMRERRHSPSVSRVLLDDQLRQVQTEAIMLENDKRQLEVFLAEKVQESDSLTLKVHELEVQLSKEKEEVKRINSRIKKFIKAHNRHLRLQEELKRSHCQVQKLGEQLDLDTVRPGINEEDSKIKSRVEDEVGITYANPLNEYHVNSSSSKKSSRSFLETRDASNPGAKSGVGKTRLEKLMHQTGHPKQLGRGKKPDVDGDVNNGHGSLP